MTRPTFATAGPTFRGLRGRFRKGARDRAQLQGAPSTVQRNAARMPRGAIA